LGNFQGILVKLIQEENGVVRLKLEEEFFCCFSVPFLHFYRESLNSREIPPLPCSALKGVPKRILFQCCDHLPHMVLMFTPNIKQVIKYYAKGSGQSSGH
jgi:hypothetical protein